MSLSDEELHKKTDEQEKLTEREWIEKNRPTLGRYTIRWDGIVRWFMGLSDRLLWNWFEEDVQHSQQWEKRLREKRKREEESSKKMEQ